MANESQIYIDGVGDACDQNPVLRVSSDPADVADFSVVQEAADATFQSGTRIEILPGLGPYIEPVRLDREQVYTLEGVDDGTGDPVIVDGGAAAAFRVINKVGTVPMRFKNLTLRGNQGVRASVDTAIEGVVFDGISQEAVELDAGSHTLTQSVIIGFGGVGARVASGATLAVSRTEVRDLADAGFVIEGAVDLENVAVANGPTADGVRMGATGTLTGCYVTIADNGGVGFDNTQAGSVTLDRSIVWGNALDDLVNVDCNGLSWTDTGEAACATVNNNLAADPLLTADSRPGSRSPCLDYGPPASDTTVPRRPTWPAFRACSTTMATDSRSTTAAPARSPVRDWSPVKS